MLKATNVGLSVFIEEGWISVLNRHRMDLSFESSHLRKWHNSLDEDKDSDMSVIIYFMLSL
ncbi:hypothetical protein Hanom_Chr12g01125511 [Helianthus anomalus]